MLVGLWKKRQYLNESQVGLLGLEDSHIKLANKCWSCRPRCPCCPQRKVGHGLGHAMASPLQVVVQMGLNKNSKLMPEAWWRCIIVSANKLQYQVFDLGMATTPTALLDCLKSLVQIYLRLTSPFQTTPGTSGSP